MLFPVVVSVVFVSFKFPEAGNWNFKVYVLLRTQMATHKNDILRTVSKHPAF